MANESYSLCMSACFRCGGMISFNPSRVPSTRDPDTRARAALCRACVDFTNAELTKKGLPPIEVHPDAYNPTMVLW